MAVIRIQLRRGTAAEWTAANPILAAGEPGAELDTGLQKVGNGVDPWVSLPYTAAEGPEGPQGIPGVADDASVKALVEDPESETATALSATYVTFVDSVTGLPLVDKHVIITVDQTTDDIADITVEEI